MRNSVKYYINDLLLKTLGISYDDYEKLDFDEQQKLLNYYHKQSFKLSKNNLVTVMISGGDQPIFVKVPKGEKIITTNGNIIAGESLEENKKRLNSKIDDKIILKIKKLSRKKLF